MILRLMIAALMFASLIASSAWAEGIKIEDAYLRTTGPAAKAAAGYMQITNTSDQADRLLSIGSEVAKRTELHTHLMTADGVMQMRHLVDGIPIEPAQTHLLEPGHDHVMFMGLTQKLEHGDTVRLTLTFENTGEVLIDVPVDPANP
jgi:copper(I)-binding protein